MREMFNENDETDPNQKFTSDLSAKLDEQIKGPLYDLTDASHYKNLNNEEIGPDQNQDNVEEQTPDYQEIIKDKPVQQ